MCNVYKQYNFNFINNEVGYTLNVIINPKWEALLHIQHLCLFL